MTNPTMTYSDGYHAFEVLDIREMDFDNFNPMCHHLLDMANCVQVKIKAIGGEAWITIRKEQLRK